MLKIVSDSSALYTKKEALEAGFYSVPLSVSVNGVVYEDLETLDAKKMNDFCKSGAEVKSSQPNLGEKIDLYNTLLENPEDEVLDITICKGISGTYETALMAKQCCNDPDRVTVKNSGTLCGPQRYIVQKALEMRDAGRSVEDICAMIDASISTEASAVIVPEIGFLVRGGRLNKLAGKAGELFKLMPIAGKAAGADSLSLLSTVRTFKKAFESVGSYFIKNNLPAKSEILIAHGCNEKMALKAKAYFEEKFPEARVEVMELCPMFMVHGGPGCISIQAIAIQEPEPDYAVNTIPAALLHTDPAASGYPGLDV